ncbi:MAG: hypothetical protein GX628_10715 [Clostridiales bacterium]|nr:hypothetical protein [Clostridiales bacterium]
MKKTLVIMLTLTLVLLFAAAPVYAAENKLWTNDTLTVFKGKVTVDGKIDDIWKYAPEFHMTYDAQGASAEKLGGKYTGPYANYGKILWDGNMVYILCYAQRDEIVLNADFSTWNKDGVELYIDEGNEKLDTAYDDNDSLSRILADGTVASSKKKVTVAAGSIAGGYLLEMSYEFESVAPKAGNSFGFDLAINYNKEKTNNRAHCLAWNDRANLAHKYPVYMGVATFSDQAPPVPVETTTAAAKTPAAAGEAKAAQTFDIIGVCVLAAVSALGTGAVIRKRR